MYSPFSLGSLAQSPATLAEVLFCLSTTSSIVLLGSMTVRKSNTSINL